ncbi:MAG: hypothetical protein ACLQQB_02035 [Solirubrobacteraceae bacterium]|jgi:hypothetical protein
MIRSIRTLRTALLGGFLVPVVALTLTLALTSLTTGASAATVIHFTPESITALEAQLGKHEVHALTFHPTPAPGHVHVSMNDGHHYTVVYSGTGEQEHLIVLANGNGARYAIATVKTKPAKATHHTLRYVAAGILIVVIVVVAGVLLVDRRRKLNQDGPDTQPAPGDSTP